MRVSECALARRRSRGRRGCWVVFTSRVACASSASRRTTLRSASVFWMFSWDRSDCRGRKQTTANAAWRAAAARAHKRAGHTGRCGACGRPKHGNRPATGLVGACARVSPNPVRVRSAARRGCSQHASDSFARGRPSGEVGPVGQCAASEQRPLGWRAWGVAADGHSFTSSRLRSAWSIRRSSCSCASCTPKQSRAGWPHLPGAGGPLPTPPGARVACSGSRTRYSDSGAAE